MLRAEPATDLDEARRQTRVARRYVLTLHEFAGADTATRLAKAEKEIAELERELGVGR